MKGKREVVTLLERFRRNPEETRRAVRTELGCLKEIAAKVFALVVFVSDGLLASQDKEATLSQVLPNSKSCTPFGGQDCAGNRGTNPGPH